MAATRACGACLPWRGANARARSILVALNGQRRPPRREAFIARIHARAIAASTRASVATVRSASLELPGQLGNQREEIADEAVIGDTKYRCLGVLVDRDDNLRILHSRQVLNRT
jgi:hypothetical protein